MTRRKGVKETEGACNDAWKGVQRRVEEHAINAQRGGARGKGQGARGEGQGARGEGQEARGKRQGSVVLHPKTTRDDAWKRCNERAEGRGEGRRVASQDDERQRVDEMR
jgi:hypothetical protein